MTTEGSDVLHRVAVEFLTKRQPIVVHDLASADEALQLVETAKQDQDAWHIFYAIRKATSGKQVIQLSLYRSHDTWEWQAQHRTSEGTDG